MNSIGNSIQQPHTYDNDESFSLKSLPLIFHIDEDSKCMPIKSFLFIEEVTAEPVDLTNGHPSIHLWAVHTRYMLPLCVADMSPSLFPVCNRLVFQPNQ
jgi:hypothetical protein